MTLGEKIREARKKCGLSQEQMADIMSVSRSAVAKWETDKGLPDVGNLKILARILSVSVDYLLDEAEATDDPVIREAYNLAAYGRGCAKVRKDRAVRDKFPDARIYPLFGRQEVPEPFPSPGADCRDIFQNPVKHTDKAFYLIEKENRQFLVTVTDTFIELRPIDPPPEGGSFRVDGWSFIKSNYEIGL